MNQADAPFYVLIKDNTLVKAYEEIMFNKPFVPRPIDPEDKEGKVEIEANKTKGACLGFAILKTKMANGPAKDSEKLFEELEELEYPPVVIQLNLEGTLFFTKFFEANWIEKNSPLLTDP